MACFLVVDQYELFIGWCRYCARRLMVCLWSPIYVLTWMNIYITELILSAYCSIQVHITQLELWIFKSLWFPRYMTERGDISYSQVLRVINQQFPLTMSLRNKRFQCPLGPLLVFLQPKRDLQSTELFNAQRHSSAESSISLCKCTEISAEIFWQSASWAQASADVAYLKIDC